VFYCKVNWNFCLSFVNSCSVSADFIEVPSMKSFWSLLPGSSIRSIFALCGGFNFLSGETNLSNIRERDRKIALVNFKMHWNFNVVLRNENRDSSVVMVTKLWTEKLW
jgi:hypothetical protein